jgi:4,5-dihydroxyphthalate decarboxylase
MSPPSSGKRWRVFERYPWLATNVYKAFLEAKALAMIDLCDVNALMVTLPWLEAETKETMAVVGLDFWKCGVHENMTEIEVLTRYA